MKPDNQSLVDHLVRAGYIRSERVIDAFKQVDRGNFFDGRNAYVDSPQPIGSGQTISAPHMVGIMSEEIMLEPGMKVLEIGSGSGYQAGILAVLARPGLIHTVETVPSLAEMAERNLERAGIDNVIVHQGDGSRGLPASAPYDRIIVTCAAPKVPTPLMEQTAENGSILIPVGRGVQVLKRLTKMGSGWRKERLGGCVFVPLVGEHGFR